VIRKINRARASRGEQYGLRRTRMKKKPRKPSETLRIYGPAARRRFVVGLPCAACGIEGFTEQAHCAPSSEKGTGYKAGYRWIVPLCGPRDDVRGWYPGCHRLLHDWGQETFRRHFPWFNPEGAAVATESAWLAASRQEGA
jgi:hypothetical protein